MKQIFLLIALFSALNSFAQKDFDYTIYTTRVDHGDLNASDSNSNVGLFVFRKIEKNADVIKIISLTNTGDAQTFIVKFIGCDINSRQLIYSANDNITIYISPLEPVVKILYNEKKVKSIYY